MSTALATDVDLVNAALLGTDRRTVPAPDGDDPAAWLLDAAARRRAGVSVAGATTVVRLEPPGPLDGRPPPPAPASELLDALLRQGSAAGIDLWLGEALAAGTQVAPEHWARLLDRARRSIEVDRRRVGAALGPRGLWFARHNPAWAAVVRSAEVKATDPDEEEAAGMRDLDALVAGRVPLRAARLFGQRVGARVPLSAYGHLTGLALARTEAAVRTGIGAAEEVLWVRWGLACAFDPGREPPERRVVPLVPPGREERR